LSAQLLSAATEPVRATAAGNQPAAVAQLEKAHRIFSDLGADPYVH
jgi:hypothetical protein